MLPTTLNTYEVKDYANTEVEFERKSTDASKLVFAKVSETYNQPYRLTVSHSETGTGVNLRRRSLFRIDKTIAGVSLLPRTVSAYVVLDVPVGDLSASTEAKNVLANIISGLATPGATSVIALDGTGTVAAALISGGL
jgi:hypothetical protein